MKNLPSNTNFIEDDPKLAVLVEKQIKVAEAESKNKVAKISVENLDLTTKSKMKKSITKVVE